MKGDFTRFTFDPAKRYTAVRKQQGRVDLDADWNEEIDIHSHLEALEALDVIGECGAPKKTAGFTVDDKSDGRDLTFSAGRFYVNGLLCETKDASYLKQPNLPGPPALSPAEGQTDLVYLEVWQRHITAIEDPDLLEPALGGADTTTRLQTIWQVKIRPKVAAADCAGDMGTWPPIPPLAERGTLSTSVSASSTTTSPCLIAPGGGYRGLENRLYRVEIHDGGQPYAWPRPAGAVSTGASKVSQQKYQVKVTEWSVDGVAWYVGQTVELHNKQTNDSGKGGTLARITAADSATHILTLDTDISSFSPTELKLRRVATYKWSRDNGAVAFAVKEFVSGEPKKVVLRRLGRDQVLTVHPNDWVEVSGDTCDLWGVPGTMASIAAGGIDEAEMKLTLSADVSTHGAETHPKLRRWDQKSAPPPVTGDEIELEDGIKIQFGGKDLQPGDYWCFAARTATGDIDTLTNAPPSGVERSFCRLALVQWKSDTASPTSFVGSVIAECPPTFPPLTDIWAEDVFYDDSGCTSIDAENVQEAIDQLCAQRSFPHHNKHLHGWGIVCGLRVVCGPEDFSEPGDQVSVIVKPGYALDCEGKDIVLEREEKIAIFDLVKDWENKHPGVKLLAEKDGKLSGEVSLIIERDEQGKPRLDLRPYDPSKDSWNSMLQGTLLMDFITECILEPLEEIKKCLSGSTADSEKGSIVAPEVQRLITIVNLIWQLIQPLHGKHIFLSLKEHTILEDLYDKLAIILASKTFCGMFHEQKFPAYPFPQHAITTLFGRDLYSRIRIHPDGKFGYAVGTKGKIGVFDLTKDILIEELIFPAGEMNVQDVAFSADGSRMHAIALSPGGETLFASATVAPGNHTWIGVKPVCGHSFLTLYNTKNDKLYGIARGEGLFSMDPNPDVVGLTKVGQFNAVGHLVLDQNEAYAYASAAPDVSSLPSGYYDRVVRINLASTTAPATIFSCGQRIGNDDIALSLGDTLLVVVVDPDSSSGGGNKDLLAFQVSNPTQVSKQISLESKTVIRLLSVPGRYYLAISYEDCFWLRLLDSREFKFYQDFHFPVQIFPIAMAYGWLDEESQSRRVYVLNAISTTLTAFPETYLPSGTSASPAPAAGSSDFLKQLVQYRSQILLAFLGLFGGIWQSLKDCFCDRLLVDCPTCDSADEVYLAKVTIRESEVYQVCNFSKRKYVKSFPTVDYWLSILPVMPLIGKAIEKFCCAILPGWFQQAEQHPGNVQFQGLQARQAYALARTGGWKTMYQNTAMGAQVAGRVASDWIGVSMAQTVAPPTFTFPQKRVVGLNVAAASENLRAANIEVSAVERYDAGRVVKNLQEIGGAPVNLRPGAKVTLYEDRGIVRYYAITEESDLRMETLKREVDAQKADANLRLETLNKEISTQKTELSVLKTRVEPVLGETARPRAAGAAASAELQSLQAELKAIQEQAALKDKELGALRTKLEALEKKQSSDMKSLRKDLNLKD